MLVPPLVPINPLFATIHRVYLHLQVEVEVEVEVRIVVLARLVVVMPKLENLVRIEHSTIRLGRQFKVDVNAGVVSMDFTRHLIVEHWEIMTYQG